MDRPRFPPRPIADSQTPSLIVSSLPDELPLSLRPKPPAPPPPPRRRLPVKLIGLVVAVVLLGVGIWVLATGNDEPGSPVPAEKPAFGQAQETIYDTDCADHAYGETKKFLTETPCRQLVRALFTSTVADGRTVHSSVAVVRMPSARDADKLLGLVRRDNTGSVEDLLRDRDVVVPGLDRLSRGGFAATSRDRDVVIVESDAVTRDPDPEAHRNEMKRVSVEALPLGFGLH